MEEQTEKAAKSEIEISVVVPVFNSSKTLASLYDRTDAVLKAITGSRYEIIFVNDGSTDESWQVLEDLASNDRRIIAVDLMKNFGQHNALMCGFSLCNGHYVVTIDDDLQIPPEEIPKLYEEVIKGFDVVYGTYRQKKHGQFRNLGSELVRRVYRKTFRIDIDITSFRIMRREIIHSLSEYQKSFTYIDGLVCWFTDRIGSVEVTHSTRVSGKSGYSIGKLIQLALNMLTNFSLVPLRAASVMGIAFSILGFLTGIYFLLKKLFFGIPVSGFAAIIVAVSTLSGVQLLTVGIMGEYLGRIHINVNNRPQYAIRRMISEKIDGNPVDYSCSQ